MAIQSYLNLVTSQHKTKTKFMQTLTSMLNKVDLDSIFDIWDTIFDVDSAEGNQLDIIGQIVDLNRYLPFQPTDGSDPKMPDAVYRIGLKAKIIFNHWDGQIQTLRTMWDYLFPDNPMMIIDEMDMSMIVVIVDNYQLIFKDLLENNLLIPHPAGVKLWYFYGNTPVFGFDVQNSLIAGFDTGNWLFFAPPPSFVYGTPVGNQGGYGTGTWS